jgi:hypothetical protein
MTYKVSKLNWSTLVNFNSYEECENWVLEKLGVGYTIIVSPEQIPELTAEEKFKSDKQFGIQLIDMFLIDNRLITPSVTSTESLQLLNQFQTIEKLSSLGDIKSVQVLLNQIVVDDRLFTQERKDKYMGMINSYLG